MLYGGSFDPPHNGHMNNLRAAAAGSARTKVVVMPAGLSPLQAGHLRPGALRLEMCRCFSALAEEEAVPALEVSGWEVDQAEGGPAELHGAHGGNAGGGGPRGGAVSGHRQRYAAEL